MEKVLTSFADWDVERPTPLRRRQEIADWALNRWYVDEALAATDEAEAEGDDAEDG